MNEFEIGTTAYRSDKIPVLQQNQLVRRLAPFLTAIAEVYVAMQRAESGGSTDDAMAQRMAALMGPLGRAFAAMPDADIDYLQNACLTVTQRRDEKGQWQAMMRGGALMYQQLDLLELNGIIVQVVQDNLANFFFGLVQKASDGMPALAGTTGASS